MSNKESLRTTAALLYEIAVLNGHLPVGMNECEKYCMTYGCDGECPVFIDGDCKCVDEDPEAFRKAIRETDKFSNWEISELNEVYPQLQLEQ